jgi:hypothetical protein
VVRSVSKVTLRCVLRVSYFLTVALCGCRSGTLPTYMQPELLYLKDRPYTKLYVEVDMVEGAEVPQKWLDELQAFLAQYCDKPDGIAIVKNEPIPLWEVEDLTVGEAALLCTDGPRVNDGEQPAYLHVFFYNQYFVNSKRHQGLSGPVRNPHVSPYCPNTVFFNVDYVKIEPEYVRIEALEHEAGHVLGLGKGKSHGDGSHCRNRGCLMLQYEGVESEFVRLLTGSVGVKLSRHPCQDCLHDLEAERAMDADGKLSFAGPFLVRREDGYSVVRLPNCEIIEASEEPAIKWQETLEYVKRRMRELIAKHRDALGKTADESQPPKTTALHRKAANEGMGPYVCLLLAPHGKESTGPTTEQLLAAVTKATEDPCPITRTVAHGLLGEMKKSMPQASVPVTPEPQ